MNFRKPHLISAVAWNPYTWQAKIHDKNGNVAQTIEFAEEVYGFLRRKGKHMFATRPFPGATPLQFTYDGNSFFPGFDTIGNGKRGNLWLCGIKVYSMLKVPKKAKKFTLWIKKV